MNLSDDRLAAFGALLVAAGAALFYLPLGIAVLGVIMVGVALIRASQRGQDG